MCCVLRKTLSEAEAGSPKFPFVICAVKIFSVTVKDFLLSQVSVELENEKLKPTKKMKTEKTKMLVYYLILPKHEDMETVLFPRKPE